MVKTIKFENFSEETASGKCILDFWAPWCGPCNMMKPVIEELSEERKDITFYSINIDEEDDLASAFKIEKIPTYVYMENGETITTGCGYMDKDSLVKTLKI